MWEGEVPTLDQLRELAISRRTARPTVEHRKLDKYFKEDQQLYLIHMKVSGDDCCLHGPCSCCSYRISRRPFLTSAWCTSREAFSTDDLVCREDAHTRAAVEAGLRAIDDKYECYWHYGNGSPSIGFKIDHPKFQGVSGLIGAKRDAG